MGKVYFIGQDCKVGVKLQYKTAVVSTWFVIPWFLLFHGGFVFAQEPDFVLSPPVKAPIIHKQKGVETDLRELIDARGLALLVVDDVSARQLETLIKKYSKAFGELLSQDPELKKIDKRMNSLFMQNLSGNKTSPDVVARLVKSIPKKELYRTLSKWMKGLFIRNGLSFSMDLENLDKSTLSEICTKARKLDSRKGLSAWRYRVLLWRWRDSEEKRLFSKRDERMAFLTPVHLDLKSLKPSTRDSVRRYLTMLRNLKLEVLRNKEHPYEKHRTLQGLLRGLRYMDTIRQAAKLTGVDHRMMTGLYIQESEFIHQRVSVAGAFSVAQFLNIAIRDVWLFRKRIAGASKILKGIKSWQDLRKAMIADPRMSIKVSCLYFRRVKDMVQSYLRVKNSSSQMMDLLSLEMFTAKSGLMERSAADVGSLLDVVLSDPHSMHIPMVPLGVVVVPEPSAMLQVWMRQVVRDLVQANLSESVYEKRLDKLYSALGLASYNAGTGNLMKTARRKSPYQALSFPLQIDETRGYVDGIMDAWNILRSVDRWGSDVERMSYEGLMDLAQKVCKKAKMSKAH